jgi:O-antigen/teichoic acid export membrane protein
VIKSGISIIVVRVIGTFLTFILSIVLARTLGAAGYGIYSFALSMIMILSIPIQSGLPTLAVRETAKALAINNFPLIRVIASWGNRLTLNYFIALCIILAIFMSFSEQWINTLRFEAFFIGFVSIPLIALILTHNAIIRGLGDIVTGTIPEGLIRPFINLFLILVVSSVLTNMEVTAFLAILLYVVSAFVTFLISLVLLNRSTGKHIIACDKTRVKPVKWRSSLYMLTVMGGAQLLFGYLDTLILGVFRGDAEIGVYRVAVQLSILIIFTQTVLNQMLQPHFSRLNVTGEFKKLQRLVASSSGIIFIAAVFPAIIFIFFGEAILGLIYGEEFISSVIALKILVIGQLLNAGFGSVGALLNMTGHEKDSMKGMLVALAINICLNFLLIPWFGMEGAALATALSFIAWNGLLRYYVKERLGIESSGLVYFLKIFFPAR